MPDEPTMTGDEVTGLQKQIDGLGGVVEKGFAELKNMMTRFDDRVRGVENKEAACSPLINQRVNNLEKDVKENENKISALAEIVRGLQLTNKILGWLLAVTTTTGTALIITLITKIVGE
jgi:predicted RNase H-like nuclease (RuvC/YqgF family)